MQVSSYNESILHGDILVKISHTKKEFWVDEFYVINYGIFFKKMFFLGKAIKNNLKYEKEYYRTFGKIIIDAGCIENLNFLS